MWSSREWTRSWTRFGSVWAMMSPRDSPMPWTRPDMRSRAATRNSLSGGSAMMPFWYCWSWKRIIAVRRWVCLYTGTAKGLNPGPRATHTDDRHYGQFRGGKGCTSSNDTNPRSSSPICSHLARSGGTRRSINSG